VRPASVRAKSLLLIGGAGVTAFFTKNAKTEGPISGNKNVLVPYHFGAKSTVKFKSEGFATRSQPNEGVIRGWQVSFVSRADNSAFAFSLLCFAR
jgi:hypothetical protein